MTGAPAGPGSRPPHAVDVLARRLHPDVPLPAYAHPGDAGADLVTTVEVTLAPGERALVPTGIAIAIPPGHAGFVLPRSGNALHHGVTVANGPGLIDAAYRGEVKVILLNTDPHRPFEVRRGDRIAQLVIAPVSHVRLTEVAALDETARGAGGYGSTGVSGGKRAGDRS